jgi:peptidoglycan/xylan/chitin deacetylase (PgdA/CDA1 family)
MEWLAHHFRVIGADDLRQTALRPRGGRFPVLVTFDDGFRDYHDVAYPILRRLGLPALVFVVTDLVDHGGLVWTDQLQLAFLRTHRPRVRLPWAETAVELGPTRAAAAAEAAKKHLKAVPDGERRALLDKTLAALEVTAEDLRVERQMLTWDEIRSMQDLTTFGGHTHTHPVLSRVEPAALETEIRTCRDRLAAETGRTPRYFAYPNGRRSDFTPQAKQLLQTCGFEVVFCTEPGLAGPGTDWMEVRRIPGYGSVADLAVALLTEG